MNFAELAIAGLRARYLVESHFHRRNGWLLIKKERIREKGDKSKWEKCELYLNKAGFCSKD